MAIDYVRMTVTKRTELRNAVQLSAYISREKMHFEGNCVLEAKTYDYSKKKDLLCSGVILPEGASEKFRDTEYLWNMAEKAEKRKDSQINMNFVFALPDDKEITDEQRKEILFSFIEKYFSSKGLLTQYAIHKPEDDNCHAHLMVTMRTLTEDGERFSSKKIATLEEFFQTRWRQHSRHHQNKLFKEWGLSLRVDPLAPIPQEHIGSKRLKARAYSFFEEWEKVQALNNEICKDPEKILDVIEARQSVFSKEDVDRFMDKHVPPPHLEKIKAEFWKQERIIPLLDKKTHKPVGLFSTMKSIKEEKQIVNTCERIRAKEFSAIKDTDILEKYREPLNEEQREAFNSIVSSGKGMSFIQGYAGTGKSYLLKALSGVLQAHLDRESIMGKRVRIFGPDNATADALKKSGMSGTENVYRFLFGAKFGFRKIKKGDVWIVDETGKLGNKPFKELVRLADKKGIRLICSGDPNQLPPIERGSGMLKHLCSIFGCENLKEVQRHKMEDDRKMNKELAVGSIGAALDRLHASKRMSWAETRKEAMENLVKKWSHDNKPIEGRKTSFSGDLILVASKKELVFFNQAVRNVRKLREELGDKEFSCVGVNGRIFVSQGDWIEFRKNSREMGIKNGDRGELIEASEKSFTVAVDDDKKKTKLVRFDPRNFHNFQLGYATTVTRSQGHTRNTVYMMHSLAVNIRMMYVALTRHVWDVFYFASRDEVRHLSHLKTLARRVFEKGCTQKYTHKTEIEKEEEKKKRHKEIQTLKEADDLKTRLKGHGKHFWSSVKEKVSSALEVRDERRVNKGFYEVAEEKKEKAEVKVVPASESGLDAEDIARRVFKEDLKKDLYANLSNKQREVVELYRESFIGCWRLKTKLEKEGKNVAESKEYREAEKERNKRAFEVKERLVGVDLKIALGKKQAFFVETQAKNHQERMEDRFEPSTNSKKSSTKEGESMSAKAKSNPANEQHHANEKETASFGSETTMKDSSEKVKNGFRQTTKAPAFDEVKTQKDKENQVRGEYFRWYRESGRLGKVIEQEKKSIPGKDVKQCAHSQEFLAACAQRNKAAFEAKKFFGKSLEAVFGQKSAYFVRLQADKHQEVENKIHEKSFLSNTKAFNSFLKENTSAIVEKLFPQGANSSSEKEWRFGSKNRLSVKKDGYFFDHEAQEGGGILKLVQKEVGTDAKGAIEWVKAVVGGFSTSANMMHEERLSSQAIRQKEEKWVSLIPNSKTPLPPGQRESKDGFKEVSRHAYCNAEGLPLYFSIRMENRSGKKRVVPLSFGYEEGKENKPFWRMKAYDFGERKRTLYNLQCLKKNPLAPVVVVEGEKTADAAPRALKKMGRSDYIAVSWSGGARSVNKTDWSPLMGREVLIWPDNDKAGKDAGDLIEKELFSVKTKEQEIRRIDQNWLERSFPKKWDLADALPRGLNKQELKERSRGYNIGKIPDRFEYLSGLRNKPLGERLMNSDIAAMFIEGHRDQILKEISPLTSKAMQDDVFRAKAEELKTLLNKEAGLIKKLGQDHHINASGHLQKDLARQCLLFEARNGREPCLSEVLKMRDVIDHVGKMNICIGEKGSALKCAHQRALAKICSNPTEHEPTSINREAFCKQLQAETKEIVSYQQKEFEVQKQVQLQRQEEMNKSFGL